MYAHRVSANRTHGNRRVGMSDDPQFFTKKPCCLRVPRRLREEPNTFSTASAVVRPTRHERAFGRADDDEAGRCWDFPTKIKPCDRIAEISTFTSHRPPASRCWVRPNHFFDTAAYRFIFKASAVVPRTAHRRRSKTLWRYMRNKCEKGCLCLVPDVLHSLIRTYTSIPASTSPHSSLNMLSAAQTESRAALHTPPDEPTPD